MNILVISAEFPPFSVGGIAVHTYEVCKYLCKYNWHVCVLTFQPNKENAVYEYLDKEDMCIYRVPWPKAYDNDYQKVYANQNVSIKLGILNLLKDGYSCDLIVAHGYFLAEAAIFAKDAFDVPIIYHSHTDYGLNALLNVRATNAGTLSYAYERLVYDEAYTIITVSQYLKNLLITNFGQGDKIIVIPKGVHIDEYAHALVEKKEKSKKDYRIIFVGRISVDKGIEVLLNALAKAKKVVNEKLILYIVGTAINQEYLMLIKSIIKELDLQSNVLFLGYKNQSEIAPLYCECDVAVVPSYGETFGKVAIEAMAAKLPIIISDVGGLSELVEHEKTGLKFEIGNAEQLSNYICKLWSDKTLYKLLSENGYENVVKYYNMDKVFEKINQQYLNAISEKLEE